MLYPEEKIQKVIEELLAEAGIKREVDVVVYRKDYLDYQVVMDGSHHSELREKLFELMLTNNDPKGDARRELKYLLKNAAEYAGHCQSSFTAKCSKVIVADGSVPRLCTISSSVGERLPA